MSPATERKRPGRKPLADGDGKTARVDIRVRTDTKAGWLAKAKASGLTLQAWIECALGRAV